MSKIFGAAHFISDFVEAYDRNCQRIILDEITKTIKYKMPVIEVDEQKLKDWIVLCARLEHIDKSDLVDIAVKKKFADKDEELAIYKRALKRACESVGDGIVYKDIGTNKELNAEELEQMFLHQAKKEWENELKEWQKNRYNAS